MYTKLLKSMDKDTYMYSVLRYMTIFGSITTKEAFEVMGNTRLASTIYDLRRRYGIPISMELERTPEGKTYGVYRLEEAKNE